jgi:hypothetical protein
MTVKHPTPNRQAAFLFATGDNAKLFSGGMAANSLIWIEKLYISYSFLIGLALWKIL